MGRGLSDLQHAILRLALTNRHDPGRVDDHRLRDPEIWKLTEW